MSKKISVTIALMLASALWMLSGGAMMATAQDSPAGSDSAAMEYYAPADGTTSMLPDGEAIPADSEMLPDGTTVDGMPIPDGSILIPAGTVLSDGTVVQAGTILYPDGSMVVVPDASVLPAGTAVGSDFVFTPAALPSVTGNLPFTGGNQGNVAMFAVALMVMGGMAIVAHKRLTVS